METPAIIDGFFSIPKPGSVKQICDCVPLAEDLSAKMQAEGIAAAVVAPCDCSQCQHEWNCADRRTHEVEMAVERNSKQLRGLACYDPLRIGESLRWIDEAVVEGKLSGAFVQAESSVMGLNAARMYPLYGICAKLRIPVVMSMTRANGWGHYYPQVEIVAADFPELNIVLATPPDMDGAEIIRFMQRFPRVTFALCPEALHRDAGLREYLELNGRERSMFRSSAKGWKAATESAKRLELGPAARRAYLFENCSRLFGFAAELAYGQSQ